MRWIKIIINGQLMMSQAINDPEEVWNHLLDDYNNAKDESYKEYLLGMMQCHSENPLIILPKNPEIHEYQEEYFTQ